MYINKWYSIKESWLLNVVRIHTCLKVLKWEERVHAGNTMYTADSHPNSTKPIQGNKMNVNGHKHTEDT